MKIFQAKLVADEAEIKKEKEIKLKIQEQLAIQKKVDEENKRKVEEELKLLLAQKELELKKIEEEKIEEQKQAELKAQQEEIKVSQNEHSKIPINEDLPKVLLLGDSGIGKSSLIQQVIAGHSRQIAIISTHENYFYSCDEGVF